MISRSPESETGDDDAGMSEVGGVCGSDEGGSMSGDDSFGGGGRGWSVEGV